MNNANLMQNFMNFYNKVHSIPNMNAEQYVQSLLNSGKISQDQYNNAVKQANQLKGVLGIK